MNTKLPPRLIATLALVLLLALAFAMPVKAFEGRSGDAITIPAGEVVDDDLYVLAATFTLDGTVTGDLIVAGQTIVINGSVEGDLMAAGQSVTVNGQVRDDARLAGAFLTLGENAAIAGDLVSAGYSLETQSGSTLGGDLLFVGNQARLAGSVAGNLKAGVTGLELRGAVGGNVEANVGSPEDIPPFSPFSFIPDMPPAPSVAGGLTIAQSAQIAGDLAYTSRAVAEIPSGAVSGQVTHTTPAVPEPGQAQPQPKPETLGSLVWFLNQLRYLVTLFLAGLLMLWLVPAFTQKSAGIIYIKPLPSLGWGLVSIFAVFFTLLVLIAVVVLLAVIFGLITLNQLMSTSIWLGILAAMALILAFVLAVTYVAKILVSYLGGRLILERLNPAWADSRLLALAVGVLVFVILAAIPFLGGLIELLVVLLGLGALWLFGRDYFQPRPAAPATVAE